MVLGHTYLLRFVFATKWISQLAKKASKPLVSGMHVISLVTFKFKKKHIPLL